MKKMTLGCAVVALSAGMFFTMPAHAQDQDAAPPAGHAHGGEHHGNPITAATADLNLTADQESAVKAAEADGAAKMKAVHEDTSITDPADKRKKSMEIMKDTTDKVRAVLTDDQKTKFDAKMTELREQAKSHHGGGEGGAPGGAPPAANN